MGLTVCALALAVLTILIVLYLSGRSGRKHDEIVLPDSYPAAETEQPEQQPEQDAALSVTAGNVQAVLGSMKRETAYHQTFTVTRRSGTHTRSTVLDIWISGSLARAELSDEFETKNLLTDGARVYIWYDEETEPAALTLTDGIGYEDLAGIPTYEDLLARPASEIREGGFLSDGQTGQNLIYVRAAQDESEQQYWISTDTGLLYRQTTTVQGTVVYEAEQTFLELFANGDEAMSGVFLLPDGTAPF